jgi:hypothetical protein
MIFREIAIMENVGVVCHYSYISHVCFHHSRFYVACKDMNIGLNISTFVSIAVFNPKGSISFATFSQLRSATMAMDGLTELIPTNCRSAYRSRLMGR